jgi:hypothetical protein
MNQPFQSYFPFEHVDTRRFPNSQEQMQRRRTNGGLPEEAID